MTPFRHFSRLLSCFLLYFSFCDFQNLSVNSRNLRTRILVLLFLFYCLLDDFSYFPGRLITSTFMVSSVDVFLLDICLNEHILLSVNYDIPFSCDNFLGKGEFFSYILFCRFFESRHSNIRGFG